MATSLKLPPELKARVASIAKEKGQSPHAFMVEAIEQQTAREERRQRFISDAVAAREETLASGKTYAAEDMHAYLSARVRGKKAPRPRAKTWRR